MFIMIRHLEEIMQDVKETETLLERKRRDVIVVDAAADDTPKLECERDQVQARLTRFRRKAHHQLQLDSIRLDDTRAYIRERF